ncbi:MAG: hypothetical protein EOP82_22640 [Variovorax sp.]|nr:MAG: hypothetical protein EOP82_22640 [Variovorax sp.]
MALSLAACGGGGGGAMPAPPSASSPPPDKLEGHALAAACTNCGAVDDSTYAGSGTGVWQTVNRSKIEMDFQVAIAGLAGQSVTLVFTNESSAQTAMPAIPIHSSAKQSLARKMVADVP